MEVYECIRTRRTVREFKPDPVPEEVVYKILQAARWAPSSGNSQPWHFIVITDRNILDTIGRIASRWRETHINRKFGAPELVISIAR
jgi:nitroreductase